MDYIETKYKIKTFKKTSHVDLERELNNFIVNNTVADIVSFNVTTQNSVGVDYLIGILIYR